MTVTPQNRRSEASVITAVSDADRNQVMRENKEFILEDVMKFKWFFLLKMSSLCLNYVEFYFKLLCFAVHVKLTKWHHKYCLAF